MEALIAKGRVRKDAMQLVAPGKLLQFFRSELGSRMQAAARRGTLKKEQPFVIGIPYGQVYPNEAADSEEPVMVQGIIDACFEEEGALVLVDYKTDFFSAGAPRHFVEKTLRERHAKQLGYYKLACETLFGKLPSHTYIYSFALNGTVEI